MKIIFIDTETTGLPFQNRPGYGNTHSSNGYPRPVQISWILSDTTDNGTETKAGYVKPCGFTMPPEVSAFNGITQNILEEQGEDEHILMKRVCLDIMQADIIAGHNIGFDINVLGGRLADMAEETDERWPATVKELLGRIPARDTMTESTEWCALPKTPGRQYDYPGNYKYPRLSELHRKLFGKDFKNAHNATADIEATRRCFLELIRREIIRPL